MIYIVLYGLGCHKWKCMYYFQLIDFWGVDVIRWILWLKEKYQHFKQQGSKNIEDQDALLVVSGKKQLC